MWTDTIRNNDADPSYVAEKSEVRGEVLDLIRISRTEMGAYLCIARNGVQPAVSKRIILNVDCKQNLPSSPCFIHMKLMLNPSVQTI